MATDLDGEHSSLAAPAYSALRPGHIRVIELLPDRPGTPVQATLHDVDISLTTFPPERAVGPAWYEAISYCWGNLDLPQTLNLSTGGILRLTDSLFSALQSLRYTDRSRYLWADRLCINQDDILERSAQVEMMGDIYAGAVRVIVWLGPLMPNGTETMAFMAMTAPIEAKGDRSRQELLELIERHLARTTCCGCCGSSLEGSQLVSLTDALLAVAKLLERPYFERLWCVQEVALARHVRVYCGSHNAPWEIFTDIARVPGQLEGDPESQDQHLPPTIARSELRQVWARCNYLNQLRDRNRSIQASKDPFKPTALCKDLLMISALKCREPLDRIFGVSKVLGLHKFETLRADYSISVGELYRRTVEVFLTAPVNRAGGKASVMLALCGTETSEASSLVRPSWVPHLHHLSARSRAKNTFYQWSFRDRLNGTEAVTFQCRVLPYHPHELQVMGRRFAVVTQILPNSECPSKHVHRRTAAKCSVEEGQSLIQWHTRCVQFLRAHSSSAPEDFRITAETVHELFSMGHSSHRVSSKVTVDEGTITQWLDSMKAEEVAASASKEQLLRDLTPYITGCPHDRDRDLCITRGWLGQHPAWVPTGTQQGDKICYFGGSLFPFVIRGDSSGAYPFKLIGDAFVEGASEPRILDLDMGKWNALMEQSRRCDAELKDWMQSSKREELRGPDADLEVKEVGRKKRDACQAAVHEAREYYRRKALLLSWIRLH